LIIVKNISISQIASLALTSNPFVLIGTILKTTNEYAASDVAQVYLKACMDSGTAITAFDRGVSPGGTLGRG
jgi:hypothetical protein